MNKHASRGAVGTRSLFLDKIFSGRARRDFKPKGRLRSTAPGGSS